MYLKRIKKTTTKIVCSSGNQHKDVDTILQNDAKATKNWLKWTSNYRDFVVKRRAGTVPCVREPLADTGPARRAGSRKWQLPPRLVNPSTMARIDATRLAFYLALARRNAGTVVEKSS